MIKRYGMASRFSMASEFNGVFQTAGQVARDFSGDTRQQAVETLENIDALLAEAGIHSQVLKH